MVLARPASWVYHHAQSPVLENSPWLGLMLFKFLAFEQAVPHFHSALASANFRAGPGRGSKCKPLFPLGIFVDDSERAGFCVSMAKQR